MGITAQASWTYSYTGEKPYQYKHCQWILALVVGLQIASSVMLHPEGGTSLMAYTGSLRPKMVPFSGFGYSGTHSTDNFVCPEENFIFFR